MNKKLQHAYMRYNDSFFFGVLPNMPVVFRDVSYGQGSFECCLKETKMPYSAVMVEGTGAIEISSQCEDWEGVLLHEMVHAYFAVVGLGRERHGSRFQAKCRQIEEIIGRPVPRALA